MLWKAAAQRIYGYSAKSWPGGHEHYLFSRSEFEKTMGKTLFFDRGRIGYEDRSIDPGMHLPDIMLSRNTFRYGITTF